MKLTAWHYAAAFLVSGSLAWVFTPLALRVAIRRGVLDHPGGHKVQHSPIPYLGGVAIIGSFVCTVMLASVFHPAGETIWTLSVVMLVGLGLSLMGLVDDIRGLDPFVRLVLELAAALGVWASGVRVSIFGNDAIDMPLTVIWIVGVTNALNLLDNMDGLSAGVSTLSALSFFLIAAVNGQYLVAALSIALAGCALGFLRHNFHPAKIYMGDAGSLFLGFLLAIIGIKLTFPGEAHLTFFVPILILGIPIFDTVLVVVMRIAHKRNPFSGGRDHTSHRLVYVGIPVRATVSLIYAGGVSLGWLALIMSRVDRATAVMLMAFVLVVGTFAAVLLALVPVYDQSPRRRVMFRTVEQHEEDPEIVAAEAEGS
jgi:UDP-GlcNAc:undecaprenyl-phosphate GlcNAc-1-phosphate transferase